MKQKIVMMSAMMLVLGWSAPTWATLIEIGITAKVWQVDDRANLLEGKIQVDDIITGVYRYDSETVDSNPDPDVGSYWHYSAPYGIELQCGVLTFKTNPDNVEYLIGLGDNRGDNQEDYYIIRSRNNLNILGNIGIEHISWQLDDTTGKAISDVDIPMLPPTLEDWQSIFGLEIRSDKIGTNYDTFRITSHVISAVPEPSTLILFSLGAILSKRRFRNKGVK